MLFDKPLPLRVRWVIDRMAERYDVTPAAIVGRGRTKEVAAARLATYSELKKLDPSPSYSAIGRWLKVDHTTVMAGVRSHERYEKLLLVHRLKHDQGRPFQDRLSDRPKTMNAFERHGIEHLSPSSINSWINAPSLWVLEKLLKHRSAMGAAAHRGTATEVGVSAGLFDHGLSQADCLALALPVYDRLTALSGDPKRDAERSVINGMIGQGLALRSHGVPFMPNDAPRFGSEKQHKVEVRLEGVAVPVIGYLDWLYADEILDLKTTLRVPSAMSETHLRQATIYKVAHPDKRVRFFYCSDKRSEKHTLTREQYDVALRELTGASLRLERFLSLSDDPHELATIVPHESESYFWNDPATKAKALEIFGY